MRNCGLPERGKTACLMNNLCQAAALPPQRSARLTSRAVTEQRPVISFRCSSLVAELQWGNFKLATHQFSLQGEKGFYISNCRIHSHAMFH